ncbi:unnamed protein product [Notodromas monacha]|uniref:Uncharacterized protein n=1 Tax=Notodromas monacha TaxID=399045 RepID=A0A7R9C150_9CRUS|nr:unnamed protein product [Notodromas monacha]CAG0924204.1 unnamed protein product [Notodromas monacha]
MSNSTGTEVLPVPLARIEDFVETSIVLKKDKNGLGLGIVGGSNTFFKVETLFLVHVFQNAMRIYAVTPAEDFVPESIQPANKTRARIERQTVRTVTSSSEEDAGL